MCEVCEAVHGGTCMEARLIPSEKLKPHLQVNDFSLLRSGVLLHLSWPQGREGHCPSPGKSRKHRVMDKSQKQH